MRVCDITREDEVVSAYTIIRHDPSVDMAELLAPFDGDDSVVVKLIETGKRADEALGSQNWTELGKLIPYSLRPKNPKRAEGAKKAQATRAAKKAAAGQAALTDAANGSEAAAGALTTAGATSATPGTSKTSTGV